MEQEFSATQAGFSRGRGTRDQIAKMRWMMETAGEYQTMLYICFTDYSKAFDSVDHDLLWNVLRQMGILAHIVILLSKLYKQQEATVRTEFENTEYFAIGKGVR